MSNILTPLYLIDITIDMGTAPKRACSALVKSISIAVRVIWRFRGEKNQYRRAFGGRRDGAA
jgi:hypothetical protein